MGLGFRIYKVQGLGLRIWEFPKIRNTFLGVPLTWIIVFGVYIGVHLFVETTMCFRSVTDAQGASLGLQV